MEKKTGAILTGGDFQALGALRALARRDVPVAVTDHEHSISRYSKYRPRFFRAPHPADTDAYCDFLIRLAEEKGLAGWMLIPNSDQIVHAISRCRDRLTPYFKVPTPGWDVIEKLYVKKNAYELARENGIDIPVSFFPQNEEELMALDLQYPVIIKPSIRDNLYSKEKVKAYRIDSREELLKTYRHVCTLIDPSEVVVQDLIPGGASVLYSFCPFFKDGEVVASITARRSRQHPMTFGHASTFVELVDIPELREKATRFLRAAGYYGLCEVEFMLDTRDGVYRFLEVNPRIWGWHSLAIGAGVNLPYMLYSDVYGLPAEPYEPAETLKWVRLTTDLPTVAGELMKGNMSFRDYTESMKGQKTFAVFDRTDPGPFLAEVLMLPYLAVKRGF